MIRNGITKDMTGYDLVILDTDFPSIYSPKMIPLDQDLVPVVRFRKDLCNRGVYFFIKDTPHVAGTEGTVSLIEIKKK